MKKQTNKKMKRFSSVCLITALFLSLLCPVGMVYGAENAPEKVTLALNSNVVSDDTIDLYVVDSVYYISIDDLCRLTRCRKSFEGELIYVTQGFWRTGFDVVNNMFFDGYQVLHDLILKVSEDNYAVPALMFLNYFKADAAFIREETLYCQMGEYTAWEALHVDYENSLLDVVDLYGGKGDVTLSLTLDVLMDLVMGDLTTPDGYMNDTFLQVLKVQLTDQTAVKEYQEDSQKKLYEYIHSDKGENYVKAIDKVVSIASEPAESGIQHVIKSYYHAKEKSFVETVYNAKLAGKTVDTASYGEKFYDAFVKKNKASENVETIFENADYLMLFINAVANTATQMKYTEAANNMIYDVMGQENVNYLGLSVEDGYWFNAANNYGNMLDIASTEIEAEAMRFCTDKVFWEKLVGTGVSSAAGISGGVWTLSLEAARIFTEVFPLTGSLVEAYEADRRALLLSDVQQCVYTVADALNQRLSIQRTDTELYYKYIQAQQMYCRTSIAMYENLITMVNEFGQDKDYWTSFFQERIDMLAISLYQLTALQDDGVNACLPLDLETFAYGVSSDKHLSHIKGYDDSGDLTYEFILNYNDDGSLSNTTSKRCYDFDGINSIYKSEKTYVYDDKGRLVRIENPEDGYVFVDEYVYNENGQLISSSDQSDEGWSIHTYTYDKEGHRVSAVSEYQPYIDTIEYYYNSAGLLVESKTVRDFGYSFPENYTSTYEYDAEKRVSKIVTEGPSSIQTETYAYDSEGRKTEYSMKDDWSTITEFYNYEYAPFVIVNRSEKRQWGEHDFIEAKLYDDTGRWLSTLSLANPEFLVDAEGYLTKVIDGTDIYEFYYGDQPADPELNKPAEPEEEEPQGTDSDQVDDANGYVSFILQKSYEVFLDEYADYYDLTGEMTLQFTLIDVEQNGTPELIIDAMDDLGWYIDLVFTLNTDSTVRFVGCIYSYSSVEYSAEHRALSSIIARPAYGEVPYAYSQISDTSLVDYWLDEHDDTFKQLDWMDQEQFCTSMQ